MYPVEPSGKVTATLLGGITPFSSPVIAPIAAPIAPPPACNAPPTVPPTTFDTVGLAPTF